MDYEYTADERATYACLDKDGIPFLCGRDEWEQWLDREGERSQIQFDRIDGWEIETRFQGISVALDGPPLFWEVSFYNPVFHARCISLWHQRSRARVSRERCKADHVWKTSMGSGRRRVVERVAP
jgi:hypothetical protein